VACSTLFARLRTLPCELRDQVYTYLWDAEAIEKVKALWVRYSCNYGRKERRRDIESGSCFTNRECVCDIPSTLPIFARSSYASDIAAENIGIFFRNVKSLIEHTDYIEEHLGEWFFASGVQARDHIRYLEVLISTDLSFSDLRLLNKEPERLDCPPYKEIIAREDAALKENLTSLSTIRFNKGFHLQLVFSNRVQWSSPFLRVLEIIKPICRTLIDEYKFKITILQYTGNASRIRKILRPHGMPPNYLQTDYHLYRSEDLQAYFDNTPKEWLLMMEAKSAKVSRTQSLVIVYRKTCTDLSRLQRGEEFVRKWSVWG
jgi:hypothetical protein